jgi:hypothetical protein
VVGIFQHGQSTGGQALRAPVGDQLISIDPREAMADCLPTEVFSVVMTHILHALEEEQWLIRSTAASVLASLAERHKQEPLP